MHIECYRELLNLFIVDLPGLNSKETKKVLFEQFSSTEFIWCSYQDTCKLPKFGKT